MSGANRYRKKLAILVCGAVVTLFTAVMPPVARAGAGGGNCEETWRDTCVPNTSVCVDCNHWCQTLVGENCIEEHSYCKLDEDCEGHAAGPVKDECACKDDFH